MPNWQEQFDEQMITRSAELIGVERSCIKPIGGFENVVFSYTQDGEERILRAAHCSHRSAALIASEMHFMNYLAINGVSIAGPIPFPSGSFIEEIGEGDGLFVLSLFKKAPGAHIDSSHESWGSELFERWGAITGKMHALAQSYRLPEGMTPRPHQEGEGEGTPVTGDEPIRLLERWKQVSAEINMLPREAGAYGLCHRDLHMGNFFVHEGEIIGFDFDDCGYDYYLQDIAMAVYYGAVFGSWKKPIYDVECTSELGNTILSPFMKGYNREYQLDAGWMQYLPLFIEKRRLELTGILYPEYINSEDIDKQEWLRRNVQDALDHVPCMNLKL